MSLLFLLVVVLSFATSSSATEKTEYDIDALGNTNGGSEPAETFGSRGSGFSESSLDDSNNAYYHNDHQRIAREVPETEEGSSSIDSDPLKDVVERTTRRSGPDHPSTSFPTAVPKTTTQVIHTEEDPSERSLLAVDPTNSPLPFDHRSATPRSGESTAPNLRTTRMSADTTTSTAAPETMDYDELEEGELQPIVRRTKAKRSRGDTFDPPTGNYSSYAPTTEPVPSTLSVTEFSSAESSTDDNVAISIQNTSPGNDVSTTPVPRTHITPNTDAVASPAYTYHTAPSDINNKALETTTLASAVVITQGTSPVTHTIGGTPSVDPKDALGNTRPYVRSTHMTFVDPEICTHAPKDGFDIDLFHEVLFSRVDCSGHVAIFGHNVTLDSGLSASLFLTIYKRLHLGGLIMSQLADELDDYIYRPADFL